MCTSLYAGETLPSSDLADFLTIFARYPIINTKCKKINLSRRKPPHKHKPIYKRNYLPSKRKIQILLHSHLLPSPAILPYLANTLQM
jgi:hypothetical protein